MLSLDINGIITPLQFQDITRQQIEKVIGWNDQFQQQLSDTVRDIGSGKSPTQGPDGPGVPGVDSTRRENAQNVSDR